MLTSLIVLTILSALTYTPFGESLAAVAAATIVGFPITFLILALPTITLALWIIYCAQTALPQLGFGATVLGAVIVLGLAAIPHFVLAPMVQAKAQSYQTDDTPPHAIKPQGVIAVPSRDRHIDNQVIRLLGMGFEGVILVPNSSHQHFTTAILVTLRTTDGQPCSHFRDLIQKAREKEAGRPHVTQGTNLFLATEHIAACFDVRDADPNEADIIETVTETQHPKHVLFGNFTSTEVRYQRRTDAGYETFSRATWVSYRIPGIPSITRDNSYGLQFDLKPGLHTSRTRLAPAEIPIDDTGYVRTNFLGMTPYR